MAIHIGKIKPCIILPSFLQHLARSCKVVKVRIDKISACESCQVSYKIWQEHARYLRQELTRNVVYESCQVSYKI